MSNMGKAKLAVCAVCVTASWILYSTYKTNETRSPMTHYFWKKSSTAQYTNFLSMSTEKEQNMEEIRNRRRKYKELVMEGEHRKTNSKRLPDVVGIGVRKCGTGALQNFLSMHPYIRSTMLEDHYYDQKRDKGLDFYREMQVPAADHELVFEKTPAYFITLPHELPEIILRDMPNVKLLLILCDPAQRALSDFAMRDARHKGIAGSDNFDVFVRRYLPDFRSMIEGQDLTPEWLEQLYWHKNVTIPTKVFILGLYPILVKRWIMSYTSSNLMIINGEELLENPGPLLEQIEDFLTIPKILLAEDFVRNPTTGLYCVRPYWKEDYDFLTEKKKLQGWEKQLKCTNSRVKGRSRSKTAFYNAKNETRQILREFYKPFNEALYHILNRNMNW